MSGGSVTQASLNDLSQYGANSFEFMNGINMWNSETLMFDNVGCNDLVITLFNASPADLAVEVAPKSSGQGQVGAPGFDFPTGSTAPVTFVLPPYGYLPIYTASGTLEDNMTLKVSDRMGFAAQFEATSSVTSGCIYNQALSPVRQIGGWAYADAGSVNTFPAMPSTAAGLWVTIYNPNLQP